MNNTDTDNSDVSNSGANNLNTSNSDSCEITISAADTIDAELMNTFYAEEKLYSVLGTTLDYMA